MKDQIHLIKEELLRLVKDSPDMETATWYSAVNDCFENDEFREEDFANLKWRINVLQMKHQPINHLVNLITPILKELNLA